MNSSQFELYSKPEYFADLTERVSETGRGDRVTLMSMNFDPNVPVIGKLVDELGYAAARGAEVRLVVDAMDFIIDHDGHLGPLFYGKPLDNRLTGRSLATYQKLEEFSERGGSYHIINKPERRFALPIAGRSHIKLGLINDRVYLGGCNLDDENYIDMMVGWNDIGTAKWLYDLVTGVVAVGNVSEALNRTDQTHIVDETLAIYVDCGVKKQSVIYENALRLIDAADKEAFITCQFFPGGPTAKHLLAAQKRNTDVTILYNNPAKHRQPFGQKVYNLRERSRLPAAFFKDELPLDEKKIHAKVLATESGLMVGSHNYVDIGVNLGTAEIAFLSSDVMFANRVISFFKAYTT